MSVRICWKQDAGGGKIFMDEVEKRRKGVEQGEGRKWAFFQRYK